MLKIDYFTFNLYQENTYIVHDETGQCAIIDPGCYEAKEFAVLQNFIAANNLKPVLLLLTHCHIDHVLGAGMVASAYQLTPQYHHLEQKILDAIPSYAPQMGFVPPQLPDDYIYIDEKDTVAIGSHQFSILFTPGHSPGSICYYHAASNNLIGGDVLFRNSIGRSDLPGGNHQTLISSIKTQLFVLPGETTVYPGHGQVTTIDYEKMHNPFL